MEQAGTHARILSAGKILMAQCAYLEQHRPTQEELAMWGRAGEDYLFLSESRQALTISGVALLFVRLRRRAGITDTQISPQIFRHSFALWYLQAGGSPRHLQELLGYEGMGQVKQYLRWYDQLLHEQRQQKSEEGR